MSVQSKAFLCVIIDIEWYLYIEGRRWKSVKQSETITSLYIKEPTVTIVVFKQNVYAMNAIHSAKIHLPPHCLFRTVCSYWKCLHTRCCVSINCITCISTRGCFVFRGMWLSGQFLVRYVILKYTNKTKIWLKSTQWQYITLFIPAKMFFTIWFDMNCLRFYFFFKEK